MFRVFEPARALLLYMVASLALLTGCESPPSRIVRYPEGTLKVRYESAPSHTSCLVASTVMAANYVLGDSRFSEKRIRSALTEMDLDETRIGNLKQYIEQTPERLYAFHLKGRMGDDPPTGLGYWVKERGYPVICVINRSGEDQAYNHAVVVIGISANPEADSTDIVHYLDPSSPQELHSDEAEAFEVLWGRCEYAMMIIARDVRSR